jgi:hypothetical protein
MNSGASSTSAARWGTNSSMAMEKSPPIQRIDPPRHYRKLHTVRAGEQIQPSVGAAKSPALPTRSFQIGSVHETAAENRCRQLPPSA